MANPENRQLRVLGNKNVTGVVFSPENFSFGALREIARYQIFSREQTHIHILKDGKKELISREELTKARGLFGEDRRQFLDDLATRMQKGNRVVLANLSNAKKSPDTQISTNKNPNQMTENHIDFLATSDERFIVALKFYSPGMLRGSFWKNVLKRASAIGTKRKITLVSYKNTEEYSCQGLDWQEINRISERIKTAKLALLLENDPTGYAESNSTQILKPKS